jgi:hypothetical protein
MVWDSRRGVQARSYNEIMFATEPVCVIVD